MSHIHIATTAVTNNITQLMKLVQCQTDRVLCVEVLVRGIDTAVHFVKAESFVAAFAHAPDNVEDEFAQLSVGIQHANARALDRDVALTCELVNASGK